MAKFPYERLEVGGKVFARQVIHRGEREADFKFGTWHVWTVRYVQRDPRNLISCIAFEGWDAEFDPRSDWNADAPHQCLISEDNELQIRYMLRS